MARITQIATQNDPRKRFRSGQQLVSCAPDAFSMPLTGNDMITTQDTTTLWHNPRCSKSRATLALLQEQGIHPEIRLYLDQSPTSAEVTALIAQLGLTARALLRTGEDAYKELNLANPALAEADIIQAMCQHPKLIERPIAVYQEHARIGRPPEQVLELYA